jgi:ABC-type Fe3+ transport system permease subunit
LLALLFSQKFEPSQPRSFSSRPSHALATVSWSYLLLAFIAGAAIPLGSLSQQAVKGIPVLTENLAFRGEIASGLIFAAAGAIAAYWLAGVLTKRLTTARASAGLVMACLPGFAGALTLSLGVLALFQLPLLRERFFDAWRLPFAFTLLLLPFAALMRIALHVARPASSSRVAELMRGGGDALKRRAHEILWRLEKRKHYWAVALLFCWAYYDLTASSLLAPADMPTAMARLYNFTHYGRITGLSALILVTILTPVALAFVLAGLRALWARWRYV